MQAAENKGETRDTQWSKRNSRSPVPHPWCFCVNAVDKGVSERFGVKAVDKGLMGLGACGNRSSSGGREGRSGDTVSRTLTRRLPHPLLFVK